MPQRSKPETKKQAVLLVILIQDPAVAQETEVTRILHHLIVYDSTGFTEGPACRRVAVVDRDSDTGALRPPTKFSPRPTYHRDFTAYDVALPVKEGTLKMNWTRGFRTGGHITSLGHIKPDDQ